MKQDQVFTRIRNISLIILAILALICVSTYFLFPLNVSLAVISSSLLAYIVFIGTIIYYGWIARKKSAIATRMVMLSFIVKIIFFGAVFYLFTRLDIMNMIVFAISFIIFFSIFLNIEVFMIFRKLIFK